MALHLRFKKLHPDAQKPRMATRGAAGFDLTCTEIEWDTEHKIAKHHTGIAIELPEGYVGLLFPRSSISKTNLRVANATGIIDSDYRGEISLVCDIEDKGFHTYSTGDRIGQLVIMPIPEIYWHESEDLSPTERGSGGYGSTGR